VIIDVLANDVGFADPATVAVWVAPSFGTASVSDSPGPQSGVRITYTPNAGFVGADSFEYTIDDGGSIDFATSA